MISTNAVKAIILKEGKLLLLQRSPILRAEDNWDLPGGLVEANESKLEALIREVNEEIRLGIEVIRPSNKWTFKRAYDGKIISVQNYICRFVHDFGSIVLSDEHVQYRWIYPQEIVKYKLKDISLANAILNESY
ncbi:MAG: NUDIX domain-containing protein [Bacteroidetes bacterium]|nr:NUDIX domain-containing protein [Bacteroidota bacterium]